MEQRQRILIIDDNETFCRTMQKLCNRQSTHAQYETSLRSGMEVAQSDHPDIVFLDVNLPDGSGIDFIPKLRETESNPEIIIITGYGNESGAEMAIRSGAWDYVQKSASSKDIQLLLTRALQYRKQKNEKKARVALKRDSIVGNSRQINACLDLLAQASAVRHAVIITGETGTGKELFARAIHENSVDSSGNFVVVDCSALPEHLVESTLFGHKKGAFTGADADQEGLIRQADGGTLFLDEIGELPLSIQAKFLRVLHEKRFRPVGGKTEMASNFRLLSATNRDLKEMIRNRQFRSDLYYRIQTMRIDLPPLRNRPEDIPALVMSRINKPHTIVGEQSKKGMAPDFMEALMAYTWPGNVRELFHTIDWVLAEAFNEPILFARHLPTHVRTYATLSKLDTDDHEPGQNFPEKGKNLMPMKAYLEEIKADYMKKLMKETRGDIREACRLSELSRAHLYQLLKKYNINPHTLSGKKNADSAV